MTGLIHVFVTADMDFSVLSQKEDYACMRYVIDKRVMSAERYCVAIKCHMHMCGFQMDEFKRRVKRVCHVLIGAVIVI